jgi:hypothetical protein
MNKLFLICFFTFLSLYSIAQNKNRESDNTTVSADIEVKETSKEFLIPRITMAQRIAIQNPKEGLMIYQKDTLKGFWYSEEGGWRPVGEVEMADIMRSNGKIYDVVAVCLTILIGLFIYVFIVDRKISKIEKNK